MSRLTIALLLTLLLAAGGCGKDPAPDERPAVAGASADVRVTPPAGDVRFRVVEGDPVPPDVRSPGRPAETKVVLGWVVVEDVEHLLQLVGEARAQGQPTLVALSAAWSMYAKLYDRLMQTDTAVRAEVEQYARLQIDVTHDNREDLRKALGMPRDPTPYMVFIDAKGRIRRAFDIASWPGDDTAPGRLLARLRAVRKL